MLPAFMNKVGKAKPRELKLEKKEIKPDQKAQRRRK